VNSIVYLWTCQNTKPNICYVSIEPQLLLPLFLLNTQPLLLVTSTCMLMFTILTLTIVSMTCCTFCPNGKNTPNNFRHHFWTDWHPTLHRNAWTVKPDMENKCRRLYWKCLLMLYSYLREINRDMLEKSTTANILQLLLKKWLIK